MNWYIEGFKRYFDFVGRSRRKEYWYFSLISLLVSLILGFSDIFVGIYNEEYGVGLLGSIYGLAALIPSFSVTFRRLHDIGRSAWWILILLIPLIGWIIFIIFMAQDSKEENKYGISPKLAAA